MAYDVNRDTIAYASSGSSGIGRNVAAVTPSDSTDLPIYARALYIGVSGDVKVIAAFDDDSSPQVFKAHPVGYLPVSVRRVLATGTTATNILAIR